MVVLYKHSVCNDHRKDNKPRTIKTATADNLEYKLSSNQTYDFWKIHAESLPKLSAVARHVRNVKTAGLAFSS